MLRFATLILPMLLRLGAPNPVKAVSGFIGVFLLSGLAAIFFLAALFTWVARNYGLDIAFLTIALIMTLFAVGLTVKSRAAKRGARKTKLKGEKALSDSTEDPLAAYIPDDLLADPTVQKVLDQIKDKPFIASIIALIIGLVLSTQLRDRDEI